MLADEAADDRTWGGNTGTTMYIDRRVLAIARKQYSSSFSPHDSVLTPLISLRLGPLNTGYASPFRPRELHVARSLPLGPWCCRRVPRVRSADTQHDHNLGELQSGLNLTTTCGIP